MPLSELVGGRFIIGTAIASGGMGKVYQAVDQQTKREVALKHLALDSTDAIARFERESEMLKAIDHPNVVKYIDHGSYQGEWYLAMELVRGESLGARMQRDGLTIDETLIVMRQLASALAALHEKGLVHRDVKPSNLMVPVGGVEPLKLVDFGLVRRTASLSSLTHTGVPLGSPGYMSPEQARGDKSLDPTTDVYALGCVMYACLTGFQPFPGQQAAAVHAKILAYDPPAPSLRNAEIPPGLSSLVMRMLARDTSMRPCDGAECARLLAELGSVPSSTKVKLKLRRRLAPQSSDDSISQVMVRAQSFAVAMAPLDADEEAETFERPESLRVALAQLASSHGANLALMKDGTTVFVAKPMSQTVDRAMPACQLALEIVRQFPQWVTAFAVGAEGADEVVDRAMQLLASEQIQAMMTGLSGGVRTDEESVKRLSTLVEVVLREGRQYFAAFKV